MGYSDLGKDWQHSLVLATGSADGSIHVFDLSQGQVRGGGGREAGFEGHSGGVEDGGMWKLDV